MKKLFVYGLSIAMVAGAASCKKSSKGKMANEWTVSSYVDETTTTYNDGSSSSTKTTGTETSFTTNTSQSASGVTISGSTTGTITEYVYTIEKDGSWTSSKKTVVVDDEDPSYTETTTRTETNEGTWDFLGGVGEFKKNERVVFNTTKASWTESSVYAITGGNSTTTNTSGSDTYADGENSMVYLIVESKKKELQLSATGENSSSQTNASGTDTDKTTTSNTMTLVQK